AGRALVGDIHALDLGLSVYDRPAEAVEKRPEGSLLAAKLSDESQQLLWISGAVLALVLLLSIGTTFSIVRPVRRLSAAMGQLAAGNSTARMPRGGIREIDTLAIAFNRMAEKIGSYQQQLESKLTEGSLQLRHLEDHDPLTQLPNRRQLLTWL